MKSSEPPYKSRGKGRRGTWPCPIAYSLVQKLVGKAGGSQASESVVICGAGFGLSFQKKIHLDGVISILACISLD